MKVLLLNGSPRKNGCTYTALNVVADALRQKALTQKCSRLVIRIWKM